MRSRLSAGAGALALAALAAFANVAHAVTLADVLAQVAAGNPAVAARRERVAGARQRIAPAGAWPAPMLDAGVANVPTSGRFDADPMTMRMVGLGQRVPIFGANRIAREAATEDWRAEDAGAEADLAETLAQAWEAYADAWVADEIAGLARGHRGIMDRMVAAARARYESGRGRLADVLMAEAERARLLADLVASEAEACAARARLDALRGRDPGQAADTLASPPAPPAPGSAAWTAPVPDDQPRLRALESATARDRAQATAMRRMAWPDLDLRASYAKRGTIAGVRQDDMFNASVGVMLPLFAARREGARAAEMEAMARADEAERRGAALELAAQLAGARARGEAAIRTEHLLADTVVASQRRALDATWSGYETGTEDLARVLESAHALYGESVALARARQDGWHATARVLAITADGTRLGLPPIHTERTGR